MEHAKDLVDQFHKRNPSNPNPPTPKQKVRILGSINELEPEPKDFQPLSNDTIITQWPTSPKPSSSTLHIKKNSKDAITPTKGSPLAAGYDLYSAEDKIIPVNDRGTIDTQISMAVPRQNCTSKWTSPQKGNRYWSRSYRRRLHWNCRSPNL